MKTDAPEIIKAAALTAKVIGIGGAGGNAIEHMIQNGSLHVDFAAIHTNRRILGNPNISNKMLIGAKRLHGMGTGGDPELARLVAEDEFASIKKFCSDADLVFLVTGLGGGTGTSAAPVIAKAAKEAGALVLAVATLPFEFEGPRRKQQADLGLQALKASADAVICLPNQKLFQLVDENTSVLDAFRLTNDLLLQGVKGVWQMLTRPGLINVDFAYLYSVVRGRHAESAFAAAEAQGENRARDVVGKLLASPLLDGGKALAEADAVLVSLVGGPDMTMADVNRVMELLTRQTDSGHVIMGAAIDPEFVGRLWLTVVVSRSPAVIEKPQPEAAKNELFGGIAENQKTLERPSGPEIETPFFDGSAAPRSASRFVAPAPELSPERKAEIFTRQGSGGRARKSASKHKQQQLPLEIVSRGRFEKSEPTIYHGEDLDVPTYIRRGIALN